ncbi:hypothetical protein [Streptomyces sp. BBFR102]|uniref:hypothetical protein n=1 Tax=Streptomyces sp. BBFR102 TaxID=3448171 RepID=UPI003F52AEA2
MKSIRATALSAGLLASAMLAACGVPPSGVIEAGEPASGMVSSDPRPSPPTTTSLFFLDDGELTAYPRTTGTGSLAVAVRMLFEGPTPRESVTATTELPRLSRASLVSLDDDGVLSVRLPDERSPLSHQGMLQLICTVALATPSLPVPLSEEETPDGAVLSPAAPGVVRIRGDGWTMTQSDDACPLTP